MTRTSKKQRHSKSMSDALRLYRLDELVPIAFVRRAFNHCLRFMAGYRVGLTGAVLEYAIKKYKSHRRLSPNLKLYTIVDEFTVYNIYEFYLRSEDSPNIEKKNEIFQKFLSKSFQHEIFSISVLLLGYTINWSCGRDRSDFFL